MIRHEDWPGGLSGRSPSQSGYFKEGINLKKERVRLFEEEGNNGKDFDRRR